MLLNRDRALTVLEKHGFDAFLATTPENVYYLSDYAREPPFHTGRDMNAAILPHADDVPAVLIVQEFELPTLAQNPSWMPEIRVQTTGYTALPEQDPTDPIDRRFRDLVLDGRKNGSPNRHELIARALADIGLDDGTLGVDDLELMQVLQAGPLERATLRYAANAFREVRIVKTPREIEILRHAATIMQTAFEAVANILAEGVTCAEIVGCFRTSMAAQGAYGSHITYGGGAHPWVGFSDLSYPLKRGDVLYVDPAGEYMHYWADFGRSAHIGTPSVKFEERYAVLQRCHREVVPMIAPTTSFAEITEHASRVVKPEMAEGFMPLLHSIGIEQYDHPVTSGAFGGGDLVLEEGMTINFETLYLELGWGVLQLEDTYVVTRGGPERLVDLPQSALVATRPS